MISIRESAGACTFAIRVQPRSRRNEIVGEIGDALKIAITAPPVEGKANAACIELLAKALKVPRSSVSIAAGETSRNKLMRVVGIRGEQIHLRLNAFLSASTPLR